MGDPSYAHPEQKDPGAIAQFGMIAVRGVWNDYGYPDHFRFWFTTPQFIWTTVTLA
jgi:hypothetical protein